MPGLGRSAGEGRDRLPTLVFLPGESNGQRSLVGYSTWGCKESDKTEQLNPGQPGTMPDLGVAVPKRQAPYPKVVRKTEAKQN